MPPPLPLRTKLCYNDIKKGPAFPTKFRSLLPCRPSGRGRSGLRGLWVHDSMGWLGGQGDAKE